MATGSVGQLTHVLASRSVVGEPGPADATVREYYVDRLRTAMTLVVIMMHTAMTYGGAGDWFYREAEPPASLTSMVLTLFNLTDQVFVLSFFFLLAGYFTPGSFDHKSVARYLLDRVVRLGIPLLLFGLVLAPLTVGMASAAMRQGFWASVQVIWNRKKFIPGPMWFAQALLIFSFGYAAWRALPVSRMGLSGRSAVAGKVESRPSQSSWLLSAIGVGAAGWMLRLVFPLNQPRFGMWLGFFAAYIFVFALGVKARRYGWFQLLTWKQATPWLIVSGVVWPAMPGAIFADKKLHLHLDFNGGFSWSTILFALWEPFVGWGVIAAGLIWFRDHLNQPSRFADWMGRRAYAVYFIHPPVLVGISVMLRDWHSPALVKFLVVTLLASAAAWLGSDPLVRLPGLRRIF